MNHLETLPNISVKSVPAKVTYEGVVGALNFIPSAVFNKSSQQCYAYYDLREKGEVVLFTVEGAGYEGDFMALVGDDFFVYHESGDKFVPAPEGLEVEFEEVPYWQGEGSPFSVAVEQGPEMVQEEVSQKVETVVEKKVVSPKIASTVPLAESSLSRAEERAFNEYVLSEDKKINGVLEKVEKGREEVESLLLRAFEDIDSDDEYTLSEGKKIKDTLVRIDNAKELFPDEDFSAGVSYYMSEDISSVQNIYKVKNGVAFMCKPQLKNKWHKAGIVKSLLPQNQEGVSHLKKRGVQEVSRQGHTVIRPHGVWRIENVARRLLPPLAVAASIVVGFMALKQKSSTKTDSLANGGGDSASMSVDKNPAVMDTGSVSNLNNSAAIDLQSLLDKRAPGLVINSSEDAPAAEGTQSSAKLKKENEAWEKMVSSIPRASSDLYEEEGVATEQIEEEENSVQEPKNITEEKKEESLSVLPKGAEPLEDFFALSGKTVEVTYEGLQLRSNIGFDKSISVVRLSKGETVSLAVGEPFKYKGFVWYKTLEGNWIQAHTEGVSDNRFSSYVDLGVPKAPIVGEDLPLEEYEGLLPPRLDDYVAPLITIDETVRPVSDFPTEVPSYNSGYVAPQIDTSLEKERESLEGAIRACQRSIEDYEKSKKKGIGKLAFWKKGSVHTEEGINAKRRLLTVYQGDLAVVLQKINNR